MMESYYDGVPPEIKKMNLDEINLEIEKEMDKIKNNEAKSNNELVSH